MLLDQSLNHLEKVWMDEFKGWKAAFGMRYIRGF